jgi:hypothetical protein
MCAAHWTNIVSEGPGRLAALAVATGLLLCYVQWNGVRQHSMYAKFA